MDQRVMRVAQAFEVLLDAQESRFECRASQQDFIVRQLERKVELLGQAYEAKIKEQDHHIMSLEDQIKLLQERIKVMKEQNSVKPQQRPLPKQRPILKPTPPSYPPKWLPKHPPTAKKASLSGPGTVIRRIIKVPAVQGKVASLAKYVIRGGTSNASQATVSRPKASVTEKGASTEEIEVKVEESDLGE